MDHVQLKLIINTCYIDCMYPTHWRLVYVHIETLDDDDGEMLMVVIKYAYLVMLINLLVMVMSCVVIIAIHATDCLYYKCSKCIDSVNLMNAFRCSFISLFLLTGHFPCFTTLFLRRSLCRWSKVQCLSKWSIVWSPFLHEHSASSCIFNRCR